jgi:A/G-specific adenine glycosylase
LENYGGSIPPAVEELITLPGVGKATAGAVSAYAFNLPEPFIETNIRRVYIYHFFKNRKNPVGDNELLPYIYKTLDTKNSRQWFYALTDYGAQLPKVTENPNRFSKHYSKQSAFEGSFRQLRGYILKYLTGHGSQTIQKLAKGSGRTLAETKKAVKQLVAEGFVRIRDRAVMLQ